MATGLVVHVSSGNDKHTEVLTNELIRIGSCDDCDLRLRISNLPKRPKGNDVVLELERNNGFYRVKGFDKSLGLTHNGEALKTETRIEDGDEVTVPESGLALQFFPIRSLPAVIPPPPHETHVAPFIEQAAIESAATARRDDAKVFLREFTRELVREINPSTKLATLAIALALVGGILYIGFSMYKEMQRSRRVIDEQRAQLGQMKDQVSETNKTINNLDRSNKEIQASLSLAVKLRSDFGKGVCLIAGSFYFVEPGTGRPIRYAERQTNENGDVPSTGDSPTWTTEGKGPLAEFEFVGTGFFTGNGFVITNRHIAEPWLADERAQSLKASMRAQPRLKKLNAYFPDQAQPIALKVKGTGGKEDLAVCVLDGKDIPTDIPVIPVETDSDSVAVGKTVVMMGYPSGPDRLLALLDEAESRDIQQRYGSLDALLGYLSEKKRIQPLTTQGSITDLDVRRISYDARTAEGGSGAPLFGPTGRVIGVNFAVFTENQASNFAVPIRFAIPLLERAGWQAPPPKELKDSEAQTQQSNRAPNSVR
jgi:serine protease Do